MRRTVAQCHRQSTAVSSLASTIGSSVDEHEFWWRPPPEKQLPSSRQLEYCCCSKTRRRGSYDTAVGSHLVPPAPRVALCHLQHHGTPFTRVKTPYQSATSPFHNQNVPSTFTRPSHEKVPHVLPRTTTDRLTGWLAAATDADVCLPVGRPAHGACHSHRGVTATLVQPKDDVRRR